MLDSLLFRSHQSVRIGEVNRFIVRYCPEGKDRPPALFAKIKNVEMLPLRAAYLTGPYILYCDIRPQEYSHHRQCFITADQPVYDPNLSAGQSLTAELSLHTIKDEYVWIIDVISQMIFSTSSEVHFELMIGLDRDKLHRHNFGDTFGKFSPQLEVEHIITEQLWNKNTSQPNVHLVILTHGLHSNVSADMFYLKEQIEKEAEKTGEKVIIRGYTRNVCKTERGVKYLGRRLAEYLVHEVAPTADIARISFIGHSLGGLVQTFAIAYIDHNYPEFFQKIQPENFISLASPFLGISNENPAYVKMALSFGIVGKTGQDLGLQGLNPLLMLLPSESTRRILRRFKRRTLYANAIHDGIVPLRTSALLYLDWKGLSKVYETQSGSTKDYSTGNSEVGEIPDNVEQQDRDVMSSVKAKLLSPIQTLISLCAPSSQHQQKAKRYQRYQTSDSSVPNDSVHDDLEQFYPLPKSSVIESIKKVLLPPLPPLKYLTDPNSRPNVIIHDKVYTPDVIPRTPLRTTSVLQTLDPLKRQRVIEEKIARRWHNGMTWRKVLVNLEPDAHNNIVVRRRFANAYGWQVIDHLVENHFSSACVAGEDLYKYKWDPSPQVDDDQEDEDEKLDNILTKQHDRAAKEYSKPTLNMKNVSGIISRERSKMLQDDSATDLLESRDWINDADSIIYDGPTGMINAVSESVNGKMESFKTYFHGENTVGADQIVNISGPYL
ncbi:hypothetical protein KL918_003385 [Ogataea parapolymorpha]|uniref:Lipase n=1 Tax=Ogataea parapolymorpha (strain ATCC 26012 / BCRC 20466 / JCM 22074 / NRRL Y-7560 / DL-1) TaxID=871575 RepID=W1Q6T2_OGAPD|nr:lipase [Ogataea parapolymorpha DL-1]ESW95829.1 lipase [Ogataea parapolymorpha DL-1]KAG7866488.1 hypothetical protein KL918_003385 [Ogataea parapolymorpha]KAG7872576.1 hypothetical protein KL916_002971 [Ogataea parapolymorpha]